MMNDEWMKKNISLKSSIKYCRTGSCKLLNRSGLIPCVSFTARAWGWCTVPLKAGRGWGAEGECEWGRERGREGVGDEHQGSLLCVLGAGRCVWIRLERSRTDNRVTLEDSNEQSWPGILLRGSLECCWRACSDLGRHGKRCWPLKIPEDLGF